MLRKLLLGAIGAVSLVGVAHAADMPTRAVYKAPPAPMFNWTGFYAGIQGGWASLDTRFTDTGGITTGDFDGDGGFGGLTLGYNWQRPGSNLVLGIELDGALGDISATSFAACGVGCTTEVNAFGTLRGRIGLAHNNWLLFATGGVALADVDSNVGALSNGETLWGWTVGAGVEAAFWGRWSAKLEYLYIELEDGSVPTGAPITVSPLDMHVVRVGLNYRW